MKAKLLLFGILCLFSASLTAQTRLLLNEEFYDNSLQWKNGYFGEGRYEIKDGHYNITTKRRSGFEISARQIKGFDPYKDFSISASFQHLKGQKNSAFGIVFGRYGDKLQFEFLIASNGYYKIRKINYGQKIDFKPWTKNANIRKGNFVTNKLRINNENGYWKFYINGQYITAIQALRWPGNELGIAVGQRQQVSIDYLQVKQLGVGGYNPKPYQPIVRNAPPNIIVYSPQQSRGFKPLSKQTVVLSGKLDDTDGIKSFRVNGKDFPFLADGQFNTEIPLHTGENILRLVATDRTGLSSEKIISVHRKEVNSYQQSKRLALIIGNSDYQKGGRLSNPVNDAQAMKAALERIGFDVLLFENCSAKDMKRAMDKFGEKLTGYETGLFFYAGHGVQVNGYNYLVPVDASLTSEKDVEYDCVEAGRIMGKMEAAHSKTNIIILDACRDNPFERGWSRSTQSKGLAFMNAPMGSFVAYSTSPGATASDGSGSNGLYTEALLKHIETPGVSIEQVFKKVRKEVKANSGGKQIPWESTSLEGDFYFKR